MSDTETLAASPSKGCANLCVLAKRVPKVVRTGDAAEDRRNEEVRSALSGIIQYLHAQPAKATPCFGALTKGDISTSFVEKAEWADSYYCLFKVSLAL